MLGRGREEFRGQNFDLSMSQVSSLCIGRLLVINQVYDHSLRLYLPFGPNKQGAYTGMAKLRILADFIDFCMLPRYDDNKVMCLDFM